MSNVYQKRKDTNYQIEDDEDSNPFLDKVVAESKTYEESSPKLAKRSDFAAFDDEELQENATEETDDENGYENLNLLNKNPLISEGNPKSPTDEEGFMEEDQEDAFEVNSTLDMNLVKFWEYLSIDTTLHSGEPVPIVSQSGNPLDGLPFEDLVADSSNDSNQRKDKTVEFATEYKRQVIGSQTGPSRPDPSGHSRVECEKSPEMTFLCDQCGEILYSMRNYENHIPLHENQSTAEETSASLIEGRHAGSSESNIRERSRTETKTSLLKLSPKELFPSGKSGKGPSSATSSGGSKSDESRENPSRHSRYTVLKHSPKKTLTCCKCEKIFHSWMSYENHVHEHDEPSEGTSLSLPRGSPASNRPDNSYSASTPKRASKTRPDPGYSEITPKKASKTRPDQSYSGTPKKSSKMPHLCERCGKMLSTGGTYKQHMLLHTNQKSFVCHVCGTAFAFKTYLTNHFRRHTGERPYVCKVCGQNFAYASNYCIHRRRHTK